MGKQLCDCIDIDDRDDLVTLLEEHEDNIRDTVDGAIIEKNKSGEPNVFITNIIDEGRDDLNKIEKIISKIKQTPRC